MTKQTVTELYNVAKQSLKTVIRNIKEKKGRELIDEVEYDP